MDARHIIYALEEIVRVARLYGKAIDRERLYEDLGYVSLAVRTDHILVASYNRWDNRIDHWELPFLAFNDLKAAATAEFTRRETEEADRKRREDKQQRETYAALKAKFEPTRDNIPE
jgi:hypothetical protein